MGDDLTNFRIGGRLHQHLGAASKQLKSAGFSRKQRAKALRDSIANTILDTELEGTQDLNEVRPAAVETAASSVGAPRGKGVRPSRHPHLRIEEETQQQLPPARQVILQPTPKPSPREIRIQQSARPKSGPPASLRLQSRARSRSRTPRRARSRSRTPVFGPDSEVEELEYWTSRIARSDRTQRDIDRAAVICDRIESNNAETNN
jgi:hypothetical protein